MGRLCSNDLARSAIQQSKQSNRQKKLGKGLMARVQLETIFPRVCPPISTEPAQAQKFAKKRAPVDHYPSKDSLNSSSLLCSKRHAMMIPLKGLGALWVRARDPLKLEGVLVSRVPYFATTQGQGPPPPEHRLLSLPLCPREGRSRISRR